MKYHIRTLLGCVVVSIFAGVMAFSQPAVIAQTSEPTPIATPDYDVIRQMYGDYDLEFEAKNRTIADYRIVYLVSPDVLPASDIVSPQSLQAFAPSILIAHSWDDFTLLQAEAPIDSLVVHASALDWIETGWTQFAYAEGMGMVAIDMTFTEFAVLTGDYCEFRLVKPQFINTETYKLHPPTSDRIVHTIMMSAWVVTASAPDATLDKQVIAEQALLNCKPLAGVAYNDTNLERELFIDSADELPELGDIIAATGRFVEFETGRAAVAYDVQAYVEDFFTSQP